MISLTKIKEYSSTRAPQGILSCAKKIADKYGVEFHTLTHFSADSFANNANSNLDTDNLAVEIASRNYPEVIALTNNLTRIANYDECSHSDRISYAEAIFKIYYFLPQITLESTGDLLIAPEREGRIISDRLGLLVGSHLYLTPNIKRIKYDNGLVVGHDLLEKAVPPNSRCVIVDGAVASGATIISLIIALKNKLASVEVYTAHGTAVGLLNIIGASEALDINCKIFAGHISGVLDKRYYAVTPDHQDLIVGDLGDTIVPVEQEVLRQY